VSNPAKTEQVCKPNSVLRFEIEVAIIHLVQPLPAGSSDLPGGRSEPRFASGGQPCWRLPIWSCTARSLPGRACHHTRRCALTAPFHPLPVRAGLLSVALVVAQQSKPPDAPPLAGSLPCSVRTFLSRLSPAATARPVLLQGWAIIANEVFKRV